MQFTKDWTSHFTDSWLTILKPLIGKKIQGIEIGCYEGRSTVWFMQHIFTHNLSHLYCIDPDWDKAAGKRFDVNIVEGGYARKVSKIISDAWPVMSRFDLSVDFIYLDGNHEGWHVLEDAVTAIRALKVGGILLFDDYEIPAKATMRHTPRPAIDAFCLLYDDYVEVIYQGYQLAVRKTKSL